MPIIDNAPDTRDPLAAARSLRDLIASRAEESERQAYLADEVVLALRQAGLFATLVPTCLGGREADPLTAIEVISEVSHTDGSAGWSLMAGMITSAIAAAFLGDDAVQRIFAAGPDVVCAGQLAPRGAATWQEGSWLVQGRFAFGSGSRHADWILGGFREQRDGHQERLENGLPSVLGVFVPSSRARLLDNWQVLGLAGTGSYDYEITEQLAPAPFAFSLFTAEARRGGHLYHLGVHGLTALGHAGFALGVGRRALDELAVLAETKRRLGQEPIIELPTFQRDFAATEARFRAAGAYVREAFAALYDAAQADEITLEHRAQCRMATTLATDTAAQAASFAYRQAGSDGLRNGSAIQRCFRDMHAGTQHLFVDEQTLVDAARVLLGRADPDLLL